MGARIVGPAFNLAREGGSCALVNDIQGVGDPDWTQLQSRVACVGPSLQYSFVTPAASCHVIIMCHWVQYVFEVL